MYDELEKYKNKGHFFFGKKLNKHWSETLDIYWCVTFDEENQDLPSHVEGILLQSYFNLYGILPKWNKNM